MSRNVGIGSGLLFGELRTLLCKQLARTSFDECEPS